MNIEVRGIKELENALLKYGKSRTEQLIDVTNGIALEVERSAKKLVKVDTGRLRSSIHIVRVNSTDSRFQYSDGQGNVFEGATGETTGKLDAKVVTNVDYAPKQEVMQPFMNPAYEANRKNYIKLVEKVLGSQNVNV